MVLNRRPAWRCARVHHPRHPARQRPECHLLGDGRAGFGSCQQVTSSKPTANTSRALNTWEIAEPARQLATTEQPQHRTEGERDAHHREDPPDRCPDSCRAAWSGSPQILHGGAEGRDDPASSRVSNWSPATPAGADAIGVSRPCQHGGTPPDQITEPPPADHAHRKRQKIDRQGLGCLPLAHPKLAWRCGSGPGCDGSTIFKHHQSHHQPERWQLVVHDKPPFTRGRHSREMPICLIGYKQDYKQQKSDIWPLFFPITFLILTS